MALRADAQGERHAPFRADGLHMTPRGYAIWTGALRPVLVRYGFANR